MSIPSTEPVELLKLMMAETKPMEPSNWTDVLAIYALRLSEIAPKLTEDELWRLIAIGAAVYQRSYREVESKTVTEMLIDVVRKSPPR